MAEKIRPIIKKVIFGIDRMLKNNMFRISSPYDFVPDNNLIDNLIKSNLLAKNSTLKV